MKNQSTSYQFICTFGSEERNLEREFDANEAIDVAICMCSEQVSEYQSSSLYW